MGRRGPRPQPTALKLARGNPGKRAINHEEPEFEPADLTAPSDLKGAALGAWNKHGPGLVRSGVLSTHDLPVFEIYCRLIGDEVHFRKKMGLPGTSDLDKHKYYNLLFKIRGQTKQYADVLGVTPTSRSGVKAKKTPSEGDSFRRRFLGISGSTPPA